jgi:pimeloyl-ACP methyl ester carboxylesterase
MGEVFHAESADGTSIGYRVTGRGDPLLLVHGTGTSGADWLFALPFLRDRFTVVTLDRRGRGDSGDGHEYAMDREAEDVLAVLDAVDAQLLAAHSYGALCSIKAAEQADRLRRIVLYEPPIAVRPGPLTDLNGLVAAGRVDDALEGFLLGAGVPTDQLAAIRASPAWPVLLDTVPTIPRELDACTRWRHPPGPIDIPALFLVGGDTTSNVYLDGLEDLQAAFPRHSSELIPGQRHIGHVLAAETFADLVAEFFAQAT